MENANTGKNMPEKKFSAGAISAAVWKNKGVSKRDGETVEFRSITLQRSYKDKNNTWQHTPQLRASDLPKAILVLNKAYEYLTLRSEVAVSGSSEQAEDNDIEEIVM